jgi:Type II CAAX prenyl endopeptidase Rce1-like
VLLVATLIQSLLFTAVAAPLGLWLGPRTGLGAPLLVRWAAGDRKAPREIVATLPLAVGLGLATAVVALAVLTALGALAPPPKQTIHVPPPGLGLLAAASAGINEEIWLRLGLVTLLAWALTRVTGKEPLRPAVAWTAIVLATLVFGALHIPQAFQVFGGGSLILPVVAPMVGNGLLGLGFGWI